MAKYKMSPRKRIYRIQETIDPILKCNAKKSLKIAVQQAKKAASPNYNSESESCQKKVFKKKIEYFIANGNIKNIADLTDELNMDNSKN